MKLSLEELLSLTGGTVIRAEEELTLEGVASLDEAEAEEVSFLGNEKYYQDFLATRAGVVLVPPGVPETPESSALIEVENPSHAFAAVVEHFVRTASSFTPGVHPRAFVADGVDLDPEKVSVKAGAVIESGVRIGDGSEVGCGAVVEAGAVIGRDCLVHANAVLRERCVMQDRVILQPGCVIGSDGYGYEQVDGRHVKIKQVGIVVLEDDVEIGANTTIDRARFGKTVIGEGSKIDNLVQIGHNVRMGKHCLIISQVGISGSTHIGDYVTMAGQAGSAGHLKIGDHATLTGRTGATKDLEGGKVYMGMPARLMRDDLKLQASVSRLPGLIKDVKALKKRMGDGEVHG